MIPFNYHHLFYFYQIAEEGSVTSAAKKLRISQSSLSMQLAQLESFFERRLFEREGKKLFLTEDGKMILSYAKEIFDLGQELADKIADTPLQGPMKIQIGVSAFIPKTILESLVTFLMENHNTPYINIIEDSMSNMNRDLNAHHLDMILSDLPLQAPAHEGIENHRLAEIPIVLCGNLSFSKKIKSLPKDLKGIPMIIPTDQSQTYHNLQEYFLKRNIQPNIIAEIQDLEIVRRLVLSGKGIAPINSLTALKAPGKTKLSIIGTEKTLGISETIYLIRKKRKHPHPLVDALLGNFKP